MLSNDLEASRGNAKRPISFGTTLVTRLSKYVSKRLESCTCRRKKQSLTRIMHQPDRILLEKGKVKKFLCSNSLLELVAFYCKSSQRSVPLERRIRAKQHDTFWKTLSSSVLRFCLIWWNIRSKAPSATRAKDELSIDNKSKEVRTTQVFAKRETPGRDNDFVDLN